MAVLAYLAILALAGVVRGQLARRGGEFPINTVTDGDQRGARIAPLPDGGFVVVWQSDRNVAARRFDADTQPVGPEFQVNTTTTDYRPAPSVAAAPDGSLLVAWQSEMHPQSPPYETGIVGQRLDAHVSPQGPQLAISQRPYLVGVQPSVGAIGNGEFVVAWNDADNYYGRVRMVSPSSAGASFYVGEGNDGQYNPAVAGNRDGSYRVVWYEGLFSEMQGRSFNGTQATSNIFSIDSVSSGYHQGPAICSHDDESFVVAWSGYGAVGNPLVRYRAYSADDSPVTAALPITPDEINSLVDEGNPTITCGADQTFLVVWSQTFPSYLVLRGRGFSPDGPLASPNFTIGLRDGGDGDGVAVATLKDGDFLLAWSDCGLPSGCDIFGQRFTSSGTTDCPGDCNRDGRVTVDELVTAVSIALASPGGPEAVLLKQCLPADVNLDYLVTIDELVLAVNRALEGCS